MDLLRHLSGYGVVGLLRFRRMATLAALLHLVATTSSTTHVHNIHWNASNPMFRTGRGHGGSSGDHVIDINGGNHPWEYDQVNIVCPAYEPGFSSAQAEQYIIYSVSKEEYNSCRITQPNPKIVALCNKPNELRLFTITFRSFTPTPGGLEFVPGQDYYFITTSSHNDLHKRVGGGCSTHNMKVIFRVAPSPVEDADDLTEQSNSVEDNNNGGLSLNSGRPSVPNSQRRFPWSQERDFRRTFSSSGDSSSSQSSSTYYYPYPHRRQESRRPKNTKSEDYSMERRHSPSAMHKSNSAAASSSSCLIVLTTSVLMTLVTRLA